MPSPLAAPVVRRRVIQSLPNLIADDYDLPRRSVGLALQRLSDLIADLQRRAG